MLSLSTIRNTWILMLTDHFLRWAYFLAIPDTSALTITRALDQYVLCYICCQSRSIRTRVPSSSLS